MTTRKESRRRAAKIKELALSGYTVPAIARRLRIKPQSVREILNVLVHKLELVRVPNSNPAVFRDPHAQTIKKMDQNGPIDVFDGGEPIQDYLPEGADVPLGFVNCHISGYVGGQVRKKGRFDNIIRDGKPLGIWVGPESGGKGQTKWTFRIHLFGQDLKFVYWESSHGVMQARFYLKRIYVDPKRVPRARRLEYFLERGEYFAKVLCLLDWQITDLQMHGTFHYGKENDPLSQFIDRNGGGQIVTDTSPNKVETEMEDLDSRPEKEAEELLCAYANMPGAIRANSLDIEALRDSNRRQIVLLKEMQDTMRIQGELILGITENVTRLSEAFMHLMTVNMSQAQSEIGRRAAPPEGYQ